MADINATDLTQETLSSLDGAEQIIMFDTAEGKRATVQAVGEYVLSKLTSSLMGSSQTVANAFTALKTRTPVMSGAYATALASNTDLNTITDLGSYGASSSAIAATLVNSPVSVAFIMYVEDVTQASSETSNYRYRRQRIVALTPTEREEYTRGFNTSNGGTSWTFQEWQKKVTRAEFDNLKTGGRNLIVNTLNAVADPVNSRPHLLESAIGCTGRGTCTAAEHGLRFTTDSSNVGNWQYFRFGSSNTSSVNSNLMGLEVGKDYTWSFDIEYKLLSGRNETSTDLKLEAQLWTTQGTSNSFGRSVYQTIHEFKASDLTDRGTVLTDHVEFTFTVPDNATRLYLDAKMSNTDVKVDYLEGDYIELRNIKLEKGNRASDWTPAPEDIEAMMLNRIYWSTRNDTKITTSLTDIVDSLGLGFHIRWNTASDATVVGAPTNHGYHYIINKMEDATVIIYAYRMGTSTFENYQKQKYGVDGWGPWIAASPSMDNVWTKASGGYTSAIDPDTYTTPGFYHVGISADKSPVSGSAIYGMLVVFTGNDGQCQQLMVAAHNGNMYIRGRNKTSAGWGTWSQLALQSSINALNSNVGGIKRIEKMASTTHDFTVPSSSTHLLIIGSTSSSVYYLGFVYTTGSGVVTCTDISKGSSITISNDTNELIFTLSSSQSIQVMDIAIRGSNISVPTS